MPKIHYAQALTGGGANALDFIDGGTLTDLDFAFVMTGTSFYVYQLDASSGAAESSPLVIAPDTNPGTKRWVLQQDYVGAPAAGVMHTVGAAVPAGWEEYTAARGRVIVGLPASGTDAGTVGTALTDLQDKTHTHTGPSHTHILTDVGGISSSQITPNSVGAASTATETGLIAGGGGTMRIYSPTAAAAGTGASGTAALSTFFAYIQLMAIKKN